MRKKVLKWLKFSTEVCLNIMDWIKNLKFRNMEHEWRKQSLLLQAHKMLFSRQITLVTIPINK